MSEKETTNVVDQAESVIKNLKKNDKGTIGLKTSQIRKFLASVNVIRNKVLIAKEAQKNCDPLADVAVEVKMLKANLLYQAGREQGSDKFVNDFVQKSGLISKIDGVGKDYKKFDELCKYIEALVAFHKYYGGAD